MPLFLLSFILSGVAGLAIIFCQISKNVNWEMKDAKWCMKKRNFRVKELFSELKSKLRGYFNYYGLRNNSESLSAYNYQITKILFKWVNRRSQRKSYNWEGFNDLLKWFKVPRPRISANF